MREASGAEYFSAFGRLCTLVGQALHVGIPPADVLLTAQRKGNSTAPWAVAIREARWHVDRANEEMVNVPKELVTERTMQIRHAIAAEWGWKEGRLDDAAN